MSKIDISPYVEKHKESCEMWPHGEPVKHWFDNGILCILYESGKWWHYKMSNGQVEWW